MALSHKVAPPRADVVQREPRAALDAACEAALPSSEVRRHELLAALGRHAGQSDVWDGSGLGHAVAAGRSFLVEVSAGTVAVRVRDESRSERARSRNRPDDLLELDRRPGGNVLGTRYVRGHAPEDPAHLDVVAVPGRPGGAMVPSRDAGRRFGDADWEGRPRRRSRLIASWSRKSRARMVRTFAELDYAPMRGQGRRSAMVTLTLPGDWLAVAPSREAFWSAVGKLRRRWGRAFLGGQLVSGLWKVEYQRRGAPHLHLFVRVPDRAPSPFCAEHRDPRGRVRVDVCRCWSFAQWLSWTWADVVGASKEHVPGRCPDGDHSGRDCQSEWARHVRAGTNVDYKRASTCTDGRRLAVYFLKHGTKNFDGKEYQNTAPAEWFGGVDPTTGEVVAEDPVLEDHGSFGCGRFWGSWGLKRARVVLYVDADMFFRVRRELRKEAERRGQRVRRGQLGRGGGFCGGWLLVNDGQADALRMIARARELADVKSGQLPSPSARPFGWQLARRGLAAAQDRSAPLDLGQRFA